MPISNLGRVLALAMLVWPFSARGDAAAAPDPCAGSGTLIYVRTREHRLHLCEAGRTAESYAVTLGAGGVGKRKEGDERTPLGRYPLRRPRASTDFGIFIGIGYPTAAQRAQGYTGSAIGIHGPPRPLARLRLELPPGLLAMDWTRGCIAVSTDAEIDAIAAWVKRVRASEILIE